MRRGRALARAARRGAGAAGRRAGRARRRALAPARCALRVERAVEHLHALDFAAALAVAEEAHALAGELGDAARAGAAAARPRRSPRRRPATSRRRASSVEDAAARLDALRDAELADDLAALWYLGWAEIQLERFEAGLAHLRRGIAISRAAGRGDLIVPMLLGQARGLLALGRTAEAAELTDEAMEVARGSGNPQYVVWALWERGRGRAAWPATTARRRSLAEEALARWRAS